VLSTEIHVIDSSETAGIVLSTYNRYVDDISAISDVREKKEEGKLLFFWHISAHLLLEYYLL
jgi:hypothetical protein